jgi:putative hydrolase of the HAD superfamily
MTRAPIRCRAVFLDAGGVLVLPDRHLLAGALAEIGIGIDPDAVPQAHYRALRDLDRATVPERATAPDSATSDASTTPDANSTRDATATSPAATATHRRDYPDALIPQLGIVPGRTAEALAVWDRLADRRRSQHVLWSESTPGAIGAIAALRSAGITVVIVTNSDGRGEENLRASGFAGVPVVDSTVVGVAKPDPRIFAIALQRAGASAGETVHVGDALSTDIAGALAAGVTPIHFDPFRLCRATDHRHIRALSGIWRHVSGVS